MSKHVKINLRKNRKKQVTPFPYKDVSLSFIKKNKKIRRVTHFLYKKIPTMKEYVGAIDKGNKPFMKFIRVGKTKETEFFSYKITLKEKKGRDFFKVKIVSTLPGKSPQIFDKKFLFNKTGSKRDRELKAEYKAKKHVMIMGRKILKKAKFD